MALLQKTRVLANQRIDKPDYDRIEEFVCADFKAIHKNVWTSNNFVISGFDASGTGTTQLDIVLAGSVAVMGEDDGIMYIGAPSLSDLQITTLTPSATNFVELVINQDTGGADSRAFWDKSANANQGGEFSQIVDTFTFLDAQTNINTSNFTGDADKLPICEVDVDSGGNITQIRDSRNLFWRLGRSSDPTFSFGWSSRTEPPNTQFTGADKDIDTFKQWADAVMSVIREITGNTYWYEQPSANIANTFRFSALSTLAPIGSNARVSWSGTALTITDDNGSPTATDVVASIRIFDSTADLNLTRQDGQASTSTIALADGEVLWVELPDPIASRDYDGLGVVSTNYRISARGSVPLSATTFWIAYREGAKLVVRGLGELETGETQQIGDQTSEELIAYIGATGESDSDPSYSSDIRGTTNENLTARIGALTGNQGDYQEDRSGFLRSNDEVTWTGTQLEFTSDIVLELINTKTGSITQHSVQTSDSPISISDGESIWVSIDRTTVSETLTINNSGTTPIPAQTQADKDVFVLFKRIDTGGVAYLHIPFHKQVLESGQTVRLGASGSGGGNATTASGGGELVDLDFLAAIRDDFNETPGAETPIDTASGKTDASLYDNTNQIFVLEYDATLTVTGTGTSMTLSGAPAFTIKTGDVLVVGSESRRITALTDQQNFTIEAAFSSDPSSASCTVSQAVHTEDLNAFDANGAGVSAASQFTGDIDNVLVSYEDSEAAGDTSADWGSTPLISFAVSGDDSTWSDNAVRPDSISTECELTALPSASTSYYIRFFANKTSGSGTVNLISFKTFFHDDPDNTFDEQDITIERARVFLNSSQIISDTSPIVEFDSESYKIGGLSFNSGTHRITIDRSNYYRLNTQIRINDVTDGRQVTVKILRNVDTTPEILAIGTPVSADNTNDPTAHAQTSVFLNAGDVLEVQADTSVGTEALNIGSDSCFFEVVEEPDFTLFVPSLAEVSGSRIVEDFINENAESGNNWTVYANTTAANKPDDFGGSPSGGLTIGLSSDDPLSGNSHYQLSKDAADRQGEGIYVQVDEISRLWQPAVFRAIMGYASSANYADGDLRFYIVASEDAFSSDFRVIEPVPTEILATETPAELISEMQTLFEKDGSGDRKNFAYRFCLHVASTNTDSWDFFFDNVLWGPSSGAPKGNIDSDWIDYSDIVGRPANMNVSDRKAFYQRNGKNINIIARWVASSFTSGAFTIQADNTSTGPLLPNVEVDDQILEDTADLPFYPVGRWYYRYDGRSSGQDEFGGIVAYRPDNKNFRLMVSDTGSNDQLTNAVPYTSTVGDNLVIIINDLPIKGWGASNSLANSSPSTPARAQISQTGSTQNFSSATIIDFDTVSYTDGDIDADPTNNRITFNKAGWYYVRSKIRHSGIAENAVYIGQLVKNGTDALNDTGNDSPSPSLGVTTDLSAYDYFEKGDYVQVEMQTTSGTGVTATDASGVRTFLSANLDLGSQQFAASEVVAVRANTDAGQTMTDSAANTVIWDNAVYDTHGILDTSTGEVTIPLSGKYRVKGMVRPGYNASNGDTWLIRIVKNGVTQTEMVHEQSGGTLSAETIQVDDDIDCIKGDTVEIVVTPLDGTQSLQTNDARNTFSIHRIGGIS